MVKLLDYVLILNQGEILRSGDVCQVIMIERGTKEKPYYCFCEQRNIGEFYDEKDFKKMSKKESKSQTMIL